MTSYTLCISVVSGTHLKCFGKSDMITEVMELVLFIHVSMRNYFICIVGCHVYLI